MLWALGWFDDCWFPHPLAEFSLVCARSFPSSPTAGCVRFLSFPHQIVVYVYVLLFPKIENQTSPPILGLCKVAIFFIVSLWLLMYPGFGLLLSCFIHARAKSNSELSCGSELCFTCWLGLSPGCLFLLHRVVNGLFCCGMQWLVFGLLWVGLEAGYAWEDWCWGHQRGI